MGLPLITFDYCALIVRVQVVTFDGDRSRIISVVSYVIGQNSNNLKATVSPISLLTSNIVLSWKVVEDWIHHGSSSPYHPVPLG